MNIGSILKKLTPTRATVAGIGKGYSDFSEREAKRGKTMATQQFVAAFQRAQTSGDPEDIRRVIEDPSHINADPIARQRAMMQYQNVQNRDATLDARLRDRELRSEENIRDTFLEADKLRGEGWDVDIENEVGDLTSADDRPSRRYSINAPKPAIRILGKGPDLQKMWDAKVDQAGLKTERQIAQLEYDEQRNTKIKKELDDIDFSVSNETRLIRTIARDPSALKHVRPETKERLLPALQQMGVTFEGKRQMPLAFVQKMADFNSAIMEANALKKTMDLYGGVGPAEGLWRFYPGTDAQKSLAAINLARQRIGKTLEGGVLRKEDEVKYKLILPTNFDMRNIADFKIENLIETLNRDKQATLDAWKLYGQPLNQAGEIDPGLETAMLERARRDGLIR